MSSLDESHRQAFESMWFDGVKLEDIASALGVTKSIVSKARAKWNLEKRCKSMDEDGELPDPMTIRLRCSEVRTAWDFVTYKLRWQGIPSEVYLDD